VNFFDKNKKKKERDGGGFLWLLGDGETRWRRGPPLGGSPAVVSFQSIHPSIFFSSFLFAFFFFIFFIPADARGTRERVEREEARNKNLPTGAF
jgi:hypothetical protein